MNGRWREELRRVFLDPSSTQKQKPENQRDHCQDADSLATAGAILTTLLSSPLLSLRPKMAGNGSERHQSRFKLRSVSDFVYVRVLPPTSRC